jgi:signal transduction histidine kinase
MDHLMGNPQKNTNDKSDGSQVRKAQASGQSFGQTRAFWLAAFGLASWMCFLSIHLLFRSRVATELLVEAYLKLGLAALAGLVLAWTLMGLSVHASLAPVYLLATLTSFALAVFNGAAISPAHMDLMGGLFLLMAFLYRGSARPWWGGFVPLGAVFLFAPIAFWESRHSAPFAELLRLSFSPGMGLIAGALWGSVRGARHQSHEAQLELSKLGLRQLELASHVRTLESEMKSLIAALKGEAVPKALEPLPATLVEYEGEVCSRNSPAEPAPSQSGHMGHEEIVRIVESAVEEAREEASASGLSDLRIRLSLPVTEIHLPLAVRGDAESLKELLDGLLDLALSAIGEVSGGVIQVTVRPGLSFMTLIVEDNGRGLSEAMLMTRGWQHQIQRLREITHSTGWLCERQARLGVGARAIVELPRMDAQARSSRVTRRSQDPSSQHA